MLQYAEKLGKYVADESIPDLRVWTSELIRTKQTAEHIQAPKENWKALNEIDAVCNLIIIFMILILATLESSSLLNQEEVHVCLKLFKIL